MSDEEKVFAMDSGDDGCFPNHNDTEWYITRHPGRWAALGAIPRHSVEPWLNSNFRSPQFLVLRILPRLAWNLSGSGCQGH
jgi:hypothetical protein